MDRRLLFPAIAATAWAQQPSQPAAEALRDRVQQYYQMMLDKKYRQAEAMVADDSKDDYYAGKKPDLKGFDIMSLDMDSPTTAKVTIRAKVLVLMPGAGAQIFDMPTPTYWKIEKGAWCWYIPAETKDATPFGKMKNDNSGPGAMDMKGAAPGSIDSPDFGALLSKVSIDRTRVTLSAKEPVQLVTVENGLPGPITLVLDAHAKTIRGVRVELETANVEGGGKAIIRITRTGTDPVKDVIPVSAEPFHRVFNIAVEVK